jgi:Asp-tRNA(Asn)/Glu-tRNA(Gln) amidotransferase A subunit family amidase
MNVRDLNAVSRAPLPHEVEPLGVPAAPESISSTSTSPVLEDGGLAHLAHAIATGASDPVSRVESFLEKIGARSPLRAFTYVDADGALRKAAELRSRRAAGGALGPLAGAVVAVKDCFAIRGVPMTEGSRAIPHHVPDNTAPVIQRLQDADAIFIGMTNMHELAYGTTSDNPYAGRVGHPQDADRVAGGSSGGSAVAVAAGLADFAVGGDAGGSVRMPAALCGVVGFKPSFDLLPREGLAPLSWTLDNVGVFASSVADAALLVEVMANMSPGTLMAKADVPEARDIRLFCPQNYFFEWMDPSVQVAFEHALSRLRAAGVTIKTGVIDELDLAPAIQFTTLNAEAAEVHLGRTLTNPDDLDPEVRVRMETGQFVRAVDYIKAQRLRRSLRTALSAPLTSSANVLVTPTVMTGACKAAPTLSIGGSQLPIHPALTRLVLPFNLTGMPAISIPCGFDREGFPVGLQIAGRFGHDAETLRVARAVEAALSA